MSRSPVQEVLQCIHFNTRTQGLDDTAPILNHLVMFAYHGVVPEFEFAQLGFVANPDGHVPCAVVVVRTSGGRAFFLQQDVSRFGRRFQLIKHIRAFIQFAAPTLLPNPPTAKEQTGYEYTFVL